MASSGSRLLALVIGLGSAAACGNAQRGPQTTASGGSAGSAGGGLPSAAGIGGQLTGGAGPNGHPRGLPNAGGATGGAAAGGPPANGGAAAMTESGAGGMLDGGAGGMSEGGAGGGEPCSPGCREEGFGTFCKQEETSWVCSNTHDRELFNASCRTAATNAIRYCCPAAFMAHCQ